MNLYNQQSQYIDSRLLRTCSLNPEEKEAIIKIGSFFKIIFSDQDTMQSKEDKIAHFKTQGSDILRYFTGINDEAFAKEISEFVRRIRTAPQVSSPRLGIVSATMESTTVSNTRGPQLTH